MPQIAHRAPDCLTEVQRELLHFSRVSEMGQMTSALAHELNQPLAAIMNYLSAARRVLEREDKAAAAVKARAFIDSATEQATRAGQIIRNLRALVERREMAKTRENLNAIVQDAVALGLAGAADSNVVADLDLKDGLPLVLADRVQIQQVVINLVRNAVEAMQPAPVRRLTVRTGIEDDSYLHVDVVDTGPGVDAGVMPRMFQPFVTTKDTGMGLGLTICQSIVQAHEGRIWATPNPAGGVTFSFRLPLIAGEA